MQKPNVDPRTGNSSHAGFQTGSKTRVKFKLPGRQQESNSGSQTGRGSNSGSHTGGRSLIQSSIQAPGANFSLPYRQLESNSGSQTGSRRYHASRRAAIVIQALTESHSGPRQTARDISSWNFQTGSTSSIQAPRRVAGINFRHPDRQHE